MHAFSAGSTVLWLNLSLKTVYHSQSMLTELALANYSFKFLHKIQQTHAKRFDWPLSIMILTVCTAHVCSLALFI